MFLVDSSNEEGQRRQAVGGALQRASDHRLQILLHVGRRLIAQEIQQGGDSPWITFLLEPLSQRFQAGGNLLALHLLQHRQPQFGIAMGEHPVERSGNRLRSLPGDLIGRPRLGPIVPVDPRAGLLINARQAIGILARANAILLARQPLQQAVDQPRVVLTGHGPQRNSPQRLVIRRIEQLEDRGPIARLPQRLLGGVSEGRIGPGQVVFQPVCGSGPPQPAQGDDDFKFNAAILPVAQCGQARGQL